MSCWRYVTGSAGRNLLLLSWLVLGGLQPALCAAASPEPATEECRRQLRLMAEALGNFRQDHNGSFPTNLGDLHPGYISDLKLLECPVAKQSGTAGPADPNLIFPGEGEGNIVGYTWEMSPEDPPLWAGRGVGIGFAQFKELQRGSLVGEHVPVIRCSHHGPDYFLNLTVDGTIYESGLYWECNFVDQMPALRLSPGLVKNADKRMSELVRPRPAGTTGAMLDLRRWYNARFEDPWVMGEPEWEQIRADDKLGSGLITSAGVVFDAAGIIQLNGKINPGGGWQGFGLLMYPRGVKSITVNRSFRFLHVLGAVQFQDPPGTNVAKIELHRTSSEPETWTWRYGVDVLNYRFVPGKAEPVLKSTVVAWTGEFAHTEAQTQQPRIFHLRFETAKPEQVVDHLDFLAGDGFSSPFIVAITLE